MIEREHEGQKWLEFEQLQEFPQVQHGVLLKSPAFECRTTWIPQQKAAQNLLQLKSLVLGNQVHGDAIVSVDVKRDDLNYIPACDGLITQAKDLGLLVRHADCQAVIFFDPVKKVIANVHCGWRGSVQGILPKTARKMEKDYGCKAKDLRVCISPSLGPIAAEFRHYQDELPRAFYPYQIKPTYFDFWEISRQQLLSVGVQHIEIANLCTYSDQERFYSYRRNKACGYHLTCVSLGT